MTFTCLFWLSNDAFLTLAFLLPWAKSSLDRSKADSLSSFCYRKIPDRFTKLTLIKKGIIHITQYLVINDFRNETISRLPILYKTSKLNYLQTNFNFTFQVARPITLKKDGIQTRNRKLAAKAKRRRGFGMSSAPTNMHDFFKSPIDTSRYTGGYSTNGAVSTDYYTNMSQYYGQTGFINGSTGSAYNMGSMAFGSPTGFALH